MKLEKSVSENRSFRLVDYKNISDHQSQEAKSDWWSIIIDHQLQY